MFFRAFTRPPPGFQVRSAVFKNLEHAPYCKVLGGDIPS